MWANAQRDGCPVEYRWRPLFNAAKFGWRPLLECRAVTLLRRETRWNLQGCPKLTKRSQPPVGRSSPYCGDMWRRYCCLTRFFLLSIHCLSCEDIARQIVGWCPDGDFLAFFASCISASRAQRVSDLHSKFALRLHHVWKYGRHPFQSPTAEIRRGKKKKEETTGRPPANILIPLERQLIALQLCRWQFYVMKLCSRLFVLHCRNCANYDKFRYFIPILRKLGEA